MNLFLPLPSHRIIPFPNRCSSPGYAHYPRTSNVIQLYIRVRYEWDEQKNLLNQRKHGISFAIAALVFEDQRCLVRPDRVDETGEQRWHAIGMARLAPDAAVLVFVVHVYREEINGEEVTRIVSARRADKNDVRRYQNQDMD